MRTRHTYRILTVAIVVLLTAGCASAAGPGVQTGPSTATGASGPDLDQLEQLFEARMDSARLNVSEADVRFMTGMIGHHAQALVMARLAPTHGAGPQVRVLTARIINAQNDEIALMQRWLDDRDRPVPEVHIEGTELMVHGPEYAMRMPGMLTAEQLRELDEARGGEFDRLFLTFMIQHHNGAVTMVHELFATDGAAQDEATFKLASDIQVDQTTEVNRMELMLKELAGGGGR